MPTAGLHPLNHPEEPIRRTNILPGFHQNLERQLFGLLWNNFVKSLKRSPFASNLQMPSLRSAAETCIFTPLSLASNGFALAHGSRWRTEGIYIRVLSGCKNSSGQLLAHGGKPTQDRLFASQSYDFLLRFTFWSKICRLCLPVTGLWQNLNVKGPNTKLVRRSNLVGEQAEH